MELLTDDTKATHPGISTRISGIAHRIFTLDTAKAHGTAKEKMELESQVRQFVQSVDSFLTHDLHPQNFFPQELEPPSQ